MNQYTGVACMSVRQEKVRLSSGPAAGAMMYCVSSRGDVISIAGRIDAIVFSRFLFEFINASTFPGQAVTTLRLSFSET